MQNEGDWDDMFCEIEEQGVNSYGIYDFPEELEDDVEVLFMMMLGLG